MMKRDKTLNTIIIEIIENCVHVIKKPHGVRLVVRDPVHHVELVYDPQDAISPATDK